MSMLSSIKPKIGLEDHGHHRLANSETFSIRKPDERWNFVGSLLSALFKQSVYLGCERGTFSPLRFLFFASLLFGAKGQRTDPFPAQLELSSLDGTNGFVIYGEQPDDRSGYSVASAGDFNGDGISDFLIGSKPGTGILGKAYLIYGRRNIGTNGILELSNLDGRNGCAFYGEHIDNQNIFSVSSAGDINGDDKADFIIGAGVATNTSNIIGTGKPFVVFGSKTIGVDGILQLSSLNGTNGLTLIGEQKDKLSDITVSAAGDINGDEIDDFLIGVKLATPNNKLQAGKTYVVFGRKGLSSNGPIMLSSLNGSNGFVLNGEFSKDESGWSISSVGDVNNDGLSDICIGAPFADPRGRGRAGKTYVFFGRRGVGSTGIQELSSLIGKAGFKLTGEKVKDNSGTSVSCSADYNGDGIDDLVIGAPGAGIVGRGSSGRTYIVFGKTDLGVSGEFNLSSSSNFEGLYINGESSGDRFGSSLSSAGDINDDGVTDLLIGANFADLFSPLRRDAGKTYVIFGGSSIGKNGSIELSALNGTNGFVIIGENPRDFSGISVSSAGDINDDGVDDLLIGAYNANPSSTRIHAGKTYVIFGRKSSTTKTSISTSSLSPSIYTQPNSTTNKSIALTTIVSKKSPGIETSSTQENALPIIIVSGGLLIALGVFAGVKYVKHYQKNKQKNDQVLADKNESIETFVNPNENYQRIPSNSEYDRGEINAF